MRPIRLQLKGFTAFREEQEIDFTGLELFAISGQTGSGKSSILDAITYALFGYVERVGKQVGQLVSQGQPRMAVAFEFAVDAEHYRVTRSSPVKGGAKILLERLEGDEWRQTGEGADRVKDANAMIREAIGLDYEAFTRSVLLPQGRFAEFLVGDAHERRSILTELLGLELFERLARRAGDLSREAQVVVEANGRVLETEYVGVTPEAVEAAERAVADAEVSEVELEDAERVAGKLAARWSKTESEVRELTSCAADARAVAGIVRQTARAMEDLAEEVAAADAEVKRSAKEASALAKAAGKAGVARAKAEDAWGRIPDLVALCAKAEALADRRAKASETSAALARVLAGRPAFEAALEEASARLAAAEVASEKAELEVAAARVVVDEAVHADLVTAVRAGVHPGDDCPVCGARVTTLPKAGKAVSVEKAKRALVGAERDQKTAAQEMLEAERARAAAAAALERVETEIARLGADAERRGTEIAALEADLRRAFVGELPADPLVELQDRIARLEELEAAEGEAAEEARDAERQASEAERTRDALGAQVGEARARLEGVSVGGLLDRAVAAAGDDLVPPSIPQTARLPNDATTIAETAAAISDGVQTLADELDALGERRGAGEETVLEEARAALGDLATGVSTVAELVSSVAEARRRSAAQLATARQSASQLREKLENVGRLLDEIAGHRSRAERFRALALELRSDRIVAFLQIEALQALAAAGSERLAHLSSDRYRLAYVDDEFFVIDTWNGEEHRSARTLSGGETFLASLALALALSEQVRSLSVTEKARLDSLFLDEGFGTLDAETLEVVVEAIEQLGGDGRMVGVITHVQELAIRMPSRIEVEKSPRGSRLQVVT